MKAVKTYDVIIIGAGPAGIFTALELADKGLDILSSEKGQDIRDRIATSLNRDAKPEDRVRNVVCGWGGAGAFSDGKLTLTTEYGGNLDDYMPKADLMDKIRYVDEVYCRFGGADRKVYGDENKDRIRDIKRKAAAADLSFIPARIRHLGTDVNGQILTHMRDFLEGKVDIMADTAVDHFGRRWRDEIQRRVDQGSVLCLPLFGQRPRTGRLGMVRSRSDKNGSSLDVQCRRYRCPRRNAGRSTGNDHRRRL